MFTDALPAGSRWRPVPGAERAARVTPGRRASAATRPAGTARVVLLGCVKLKLAHRSPARDLYVSPLWNSRRAYAEAAGWPWLILSAKHGVLDPEQSIAPYDVALADLTAIARRAWGKRVVTALRARFASLDGMTFEVHAGAAYREAIEPGLQELGATMEQPLLGLTIGRQLSWYRSHASAAESRAAPAKRRRLATTVQVSRALHALEKRPRRVAAIDWPAGG
jgi:hypothetical protein